VQHRQAPAGGNAIWNYLLDGKQPAAAGEHCNITSQLLKQTHTQGRGREDEVLSQK